MAPILVAHTRELYLKSPTPQPPHELTLRVLATMQSTPEPRLRAIMASLVTHLHAFVQDVGLTEAEFRSACAHIARLGQLSNANHNEVVLMAGSLGISSLVCQINNAGDAQTDVASTHNLLGPFWRMRSPATPNGGSIVRSPTPGMPMQVRAQVLNMQGAPVADALVDVWHCDAQGLYENQAQARAQGVADMNLRGQFRTDAQGRFDFWSIKPLGYPIPTDGVVGQLLQAQGRHAMRPAHVHALVFKPGYKTLISQVYAHDDANLGSDVQFGVTPALTGHYVQHSAPPAGRSDVALPWCSLDFVFRMQAGEAVLPQAPIQ